MALSSHQKENNRCIAPMTFEQEQYNKNRFNDFIIRAVTLSAEQRLYRQSNDFVVRATTLSAEQSKFDLPDLSGQLTRYHFRTPPRPPTVGQGRREDLLHYDYRRQRKWQLVRSRFDHTCATL
jgi:hypothetical protein